MRCAEEPTCIGRPLRWCSESRISEVTRADRQIAKSANFGLLYGMSADGFALYAMTAYGVSLSGDEAEELRSRFFRAYPGLRRWHIACHRKAESSSNNNTRTIFGRLLVAQKDEHWARFNMVTEYVVSGSCADVVKLAMVRIDAVLPEGVHLAATIHDELVYDAPIEIAEFCRALVQEKMREAFVEMFGDAVPVQVDAKVCSNWGEK